VRGIGPEGTAWIYPAATPLHACGWVIGAAALALFVANVAMPRFFCRILCPLGALLGLIGAGIANMILALTLSQWATFARLMRGDVLSIRDLEYVQSARTAGLPDRRIMVKHLIPNAIMPVLVLATLDIGSVILATAGLSFLGLGIPPGIPEWGSMIGAGKEFLRTAPLNIIVPGLAITVVVLLFNLLGEGLRDILDVHKDQVNIA